MAERFIRVDGIERINSIIRKVEDAITDRRMMLEIGEYIRFRIQARTAEGKDVRGNNFKPYSPKYNLFRQASGHPSKVNLFFTGSMMSSMAIAETASQVRVYFTNTQDQSGSRNPEKAYYLNKTREFFALSPDDVRGINKIIGEYYGNAAKR